MDKEKLKTESKKWGKRAAFFAVFGFTGLAVVGAVRLYKTVKGFDSLDLKGMHSDYDGDDK